MEDSRRLLTLCVVAAVVAMAVPAAHAAGANGASHETVKLGYHEGLLAAMQRGGCHYVFNWLPVVRWQNAIRDSQMTSLRKGFPLSLPDGCENKPRREVVRQAKTGLFLLEKGEEAVANGSNSESVERDKSTLKSDLGKADKRAHDAEAEVVNLKRQLDALLREKAAARSAGWRTALQGAGGGAFLIVVIWFAWFRRLKKIAGIFYDTEEVLFGIRRIFFRRVPGTILYKCPECPSNVAPVSLQRHGGETHLQKMHAALLVFSKPVPFFVRSRTGTDG